MNNRYCPHCGFKNTWEIQKPKSCSKCYKDMDKAFAVAAPVAPVVAPTQSPVVPKDKRIFDARGNDITHRFQSLNQPARARQQYEGQDDDYVDLSEMHNQAQELAASISPDDFVIQMDETPKVTSLGSVLGPILQQQQQNAAKSPKTPRKRKTSK